MNNTRAPGADARRAAELHALRLQLFKTLAEVLNVVEETDMWHVPLTRGLISLIPKGEGTASQKLRSMDLMASVCRLWASIGIRGMVHWQRNWADTALHGCRRRRRAKDVWMDLALAVRVC